MNTKQTPKTTVVKFTYGGIYHGRINWSLLKHLGSLQGPQHWHKLPIHITFITHYPTTRESLITINNRKHSSYFSYGFKYKHSTYTALHNIFHQITKGFNSPRQHHTVAVALNMSKTFDTVNKNKLITNKHYEHHLVYNQLHLRTSSMHSIQWHTFKI